MRFVHSLIALASVCLLASCVSMPAPEQQATLSNVMLLRSTDIPPVALGEFALAPNLPAAMDRSISVRADTLRAPNGSFASYLRQTFDTELRAAGKLDANSATVISAQLTQSRLQTGANPATGAIGARFVVTRNGQTIYDDEHAVTDSWPSAFMGAIAIPEAMDRYTALYPALVAQLFNDPEFRQALRQ